MSKYPKADISKMTLNSVSTRFSKVGEDDWGNPFAPGEEFEKFVDSLPAVLAADQLRRFAAVCADAVRFKKPIVMMMGGHVVKVGLSPLVCELIEERIITAVAMNSSAAIHDVESTLFGQTSEDVAAGIRDGSFGMARETGEFFNGTVARAYESGDSEIGMGEALGAALADSGESRKGILQTAWEHDVPVSVHVAIGADITHQQPSMDGAATGALTYRDFRLLAETVRHIGSGGVVMNWGSAVILPEVFLKALTVARNLGADAFDFTTANFDMIRHYRTGENVVKRPTKDGGTGFNFVGHHEIMFPLTAAMIKSELKTT